LPHSKRKTWGERSRRRIGKPAPEDSYDDARLTYELGNRVGELRESRGLSRLELAERMHTTQSVIARLEAGGTKPSLTTLERVAVALGASVDIRLRAAG
jgi:ribosome-binding protein aMBF1 (putative translation factor)